MKELINNSFYKTLEEKYKNLLLDYVLLETDEVYIGAESHKEAVKQAIAVFNTRKRVGNSLKPPKFFVEEDKMTCRKISLEEFLFDEDSSWEMTSEHTGYRETPNDMSYWWAFSEPPYPTGYTREDFRKLNHAIFPLAYRNDLEIYRWNDEFSNYFDEGKDWWGTGFWSVYDKWMNRFVIIGASLSD